MGVALGAAPPSAAATPGKAPTVRVSCNRASLVSAIQTANTIGAARLLLSPNCIYNYTTEAGSGNALPIITGNIALVGGPSTTIRRDSTAPTAFRILQVASGARLQIWGISILGGSTAGLGGGILNAGTLTLYRTTLSGNRAGNGGALSNSAGATTTISYSVLNANSTTSVGGGAAINFGTLTVFASIMAVNNAPVNGGAVNTQPGGVSRLIRTTVENNISGGLGGGLSNLGTTTLDRVLVTQNKGSGGGGVATGNSNVTVRLSIIRNNIPDNCSPLNTIPGCVN